MLKINKEYLKEIIKEMISQEMPQENKDEDFYCFDFLCNNRESLIYKDIIEEIYGNSCWEDSKEIKNKTSAYFFDETKIGEIINNFIIQFNEFKEYNLNPDDTNMIIEYYDNIVQSYDYYKFIFTENEDTEHDNYGNHNVIRTMKINIEEIANYLISFKYTKDISDIKKITNLTEKELEIIKNKPFIFNEILNEEINNCNKNNKKIKI